MFRFESLILVRLLEIYFIIIPLQRVDRNSRLVGKHCVYCSLFFKGLAVFLHQEELLSDLLLPLKIPQNFAFWIAYSSNCCEVTKIAPKIAPHFWVDMLCLFLGLSFPLCVRAASYGRCSFLLSTWNNFTAELQIRGFDCCHQLGEVQLNLQWCLNDQYFSWNFI